MINLFIPYYVDKVPARQAEIDRCVLMNKSNKAIDRMFLICDDFPAPAINNATYYLIHYRPTYAAMFDIINSVTGPDDWNVLVNSDIYTDDTIGLLNKYTHNDFIALSRWDVDIKGNVTHLNRWDSQDTWAFKGRARRMNADFFQGVAGCDNAIANRAHVAGYNVMNPSKSIKTYHLHNSGVRNYNPSNRVPQPYKMITPHE